jgi:solute carrier family 25 carnitine/acylcarnitine transporter 20/29
MIYRYFATYEITKKALTPAGSSPADLKLGTVILAGGSAGVAMWAIAIPPDVITPFHLLGFLSK